MLQKPGLILNISRFRNSRIRDIFFANRVPAPGLLVPPCQWVGRLLWLFVVSFQPCLCNTPSAFHSHSFAGGWRGEDGMLWLWLGVAFGLTVRLCCCRLCCFFCCCCCCRSWEVRDLGGLQSAVGPTLLAAAFGGGNCRPRVDEASRMGGGGPVRRSAGVCKNEPANEPSRRATLHRIGDAWGAHLTGCGYNEPAACVCTRVCQARARNFDRRPNALRGAWDPEEFLRNNIYNYNAYTRNRPYLKLP